MTEGYYTIISAIASFFAIIFSWITIGTRNWKWYIPTVLFAFVSLAAAAIRFLVI